MMSIQIIKYNFGCVFFCATTFVKKFAFEKKMRMFSKNYLLAKRR